MKKVFIISHAMTDEINQKRWLDFSQLTNDWQTTLIVPKIWRNAWFGKKQEKITACKKIDNLEVLPVYTTNKEKWTLFLIPSLPSILRKSRPDIVFCFQEEGTISLCWNLLCIKIFSPSTKVGFFSWQNIKIHGDKWHQRLRWNLTKLLSDFFIAGSNEIAELFKSTGYNKEIYVQTEIGVSKKLFYQDSSLRNQFRDKHNLKEELVIGFAGRMIQEKGIYDLSDALSKIDGINFKMVWAGDGDQLDKLKDIRKEDIFLGKISMKEMHEFYNGIDLMILPSKTSPDWKEQFGLVAAQSLLCKTPVIGSNSGAIPEVIDNEDYIFDEGNSDQLAELITKFSKNLLSPPSSAHKFLTENIAKTTKEIIIQQCNS